MPGVSFALIMLLVPTRQTTQVMVRVRTQFRTALAPRTWFRSVRQVVPKRLSKLLCPPYSSAMRFGKSGRPNVRQNYKEPNVTSLAAY